MTTKEAIELAMKVADENGWVWLEPVEVRKQRRWFRFTGWIVQTNAQEMGCNVRVEIDNASGKVVRAAFWPR